MKYKKKMTGLRKFAVIETIKREYTLCLGVEQLHKFTGISIVKLYKIFGDGEYYSIGNLEIFLLNEY